MSEAVGPKTQPKKTYQKPEAVRVALRPDEAVLGNCKSGSASGPGGSGSCIVVGTCFSQGS